MGTFGYARILVFSAFCILCCENTGTAVGEVWQTKTACYGADQSCSQFRLDCPTGEGIVLGLLNYATKEGDSHCPFGVSNCMATNGNSAHDCCFYSDKDTFRLFSQADEDYVSGNCLGRSSCVGWAPRFKITPYSQYVVISYTCRADPTPSRSTNTVQCGSNTTPIAGSPCASHTAPTLPSNTVTSSVPSTQSTHTPGTVSSAAVASPSLHSETPYTPPSTSASETITTTITNPTLTQTATSDPTKNTGLETASLSPVTPASHTDLRTYQMSSKPSWIPTNVASIIHKLPATADTHHSSHVTHKSDEEVSHEHTHPSIEPTSATNNVSTMSPSAITSLVMGSSNAFSSTNAHSTGRSPSVESARPSVTVVSLVRDGSTADPIGLVSSSHSTDTTSNATVTREASSSGDSSARPGGTVDTYRDDTTTVSHTASTIGGTVERYRDDTTAASIIISTAATLQTTASLDDPTEDDDGGINKSVVIGAILGAVIVVAVISAVISCLCIRLKRKEKIRRNYIRNTNIFYSFPDGRDDVGITESPVPPSKRSNSMKVPRSNHSDAMVNTATKAQNNMLVDGFISETYDNSNNVLLSSSFPDTNPYALLSIESHTETRELYPELPKDDTTEARDQYPAYPQDNSTETSEETIDFINDVEFNDDDQQETSQSDTIPRNKEVTFDPSSLYAKVHKIGQTKF